MCHLNFSASCTDTLQALSLKLYDAWKAVMQSGMFQLVPTTKSINELSTWICLMVRNVIL